MGEARGGRDYYMPDLPEGGVCDPNARKTTMYDCTNGGGAVMGCLTVDGGNVPQINQVLSPGTFIAGTTIPTYYLTTIVEPQDPSLLGNYDFPTVPNVFLCGYNCPPVSGGGCVWAGSQIGQFSNWQACDNAITSGTCTPCMKVTLINTCPQNSSYYGYYGTPGVPSPGGSWFFPQLLNLTTNIHYYPPGPTFFCATIDNQTPTQANVGTFIEGLPGIPGEQWEVYSVEPPDIISHQSTGGIIYDLNTTSC